MRSPHRLGVIAVVLTSALLVAGCSAPAPEPDPTETTASTPTSSPEPEPDDTSTEAPIAEDATCETIIPAETVADFESIGWTVQADRFYLGELEIADGLQCVWADFDGPAGDHVQLFGWAPITASQAETAQAELEGQGWIREDGAEGVYITENPDTTIAVDDEGYGLTYLFGDGWVIFADTKQGLLLIERP